MSPSMVNARGQDMQAGRFPDVLADRRRALQSNKEATTKTATDLLQRIDGKKGRWNCTARETPAAKGHIRATCKATCPLARTRPMGRGARREPEGRQGRIPGLSAPVDRLDLPWNTCVAMNVVCPLGVGLPRSVAGWGVWWAEVEGLV